MWTVIAARAAGTGWFACLDEHAIPAYGIATPVLECPADNWQMMRNRS
jgi:hypothetical protein